MVSLDVKLPLISAQLDLLSSLLNHEQKTQLAEHMKECECTNTDHEQGKTHVTLRYFSNLEAFAELYAHYNWAGAASCYPKRLPKDATPFAFNHYANIPGGNSKGAVAYSAGAHYWLVAWDEHCNKIYVKYAEKCPIDWCAIEKALDASEKYSIAVYPGTQTVAAMANINNGKASVAFYNFKV